MKDKRQGNDLKVAWSIFMQDGEPFRLDGKDVSLYLKNMFGRKELNDFVVTGNIIQWTFYGKDQKNSGKYSLELVINEGEKGMITTDKCDFVNLVSCSCKLQGGEDAPNVETESIELTSTLEYVAGGMSEEEVLNLLDGKVDKEKGKGLSSNDYTTAEKNKLSSLENYDDSGLRAELSRIDTTKASKEDVEELSERIAENDVLIEDLQNTKIDKEADDYYPQLSVGVADNLSGVEVVDSSFTTRQSGGGAITDGVARVQSIKGNSVVWNQLVSTDRIISLQGDVNITILESGEIYAEGEGESFLGSSLLTPQVPLENGHKYLYNFDVKKDIKETIGVYFGNVWNNPSGGFPIPADTWYHVESIAAPTGELNRGLWIYPWNNTQLTACKAWIKNLVVYDLTQMFGAGNEPSTIEEYNARKPIVADEYAYNEGEVIDMNVQGIKSVGRNVWDEQWESGTIAGSDGALVDDSTKIRTKNLIRVLPNKEYHFTQPSQLPIRVFWYGADKAYKAYDYFAESTSFLIPSDVHYIKVVFEYPTYNNDICINLSDASVNGKYFPYVKRTEDLSIIRKYFPNGMKSAGTAHDEIRYNKVTQKWEKVQRIGEVDMGSLLWTIDGRGRFQSTSILGVISPVLSGAYANVLTNEYVVDTATNTYDRINDKVIAVSSDGYLKVVDSTYTDAASFKAAMAGVILYYELAEPIVTEIDEQDFNTDYLVWNGGTESALASKSSSALRAEITYGFNAVGKIKEIDDKLTELSAEVSGLSERIENLPSGESSVFEAIYGVTTYEEIIEAYNAGKYVVCLYEELAYHLSSLKNNTAWFGAIDGDLSFRTWCNKSNVWFKVQYNLELTSNKTKTINESSTDTQYPSAKAVYDFVSNTLGTIINGDY